MLASLLAAANLGNAFFYETWNFYGAIQVIGVSLLIVALLALPGQRIVAIARSRPRASVAALAALMATAFASTLVTVSAHLPALVRNASSPVASIAEQPLSIPSLAALVHLASIEKLAERCGLDQEGASRIVVDHMSYYALRDIRRPIHVLYVSDLGFGGGKAEGWLDPFLRGLGSPGVLARCDWMPPLDAAVVHGERGYCCARLR